MTFLGRPLAIALLFLAATAQADIEGSADHPIITRYPGSTIEWFFEDNNRPFRLPVGPVTGYREIGDWVETQGRITRIYYALDGGGRTETEVYQNYLEALEKAGMEILAQGIHDAAARGGDVGTRQWQGLYVAANPWTTGGAVDEMARGTATSGGRGSIIARKDRPEGMAYVAVNIYLFREDRIGILVDIVEEEAAETGLIVVDAEAIGRQMVEAGRVVLDGILFDYDKATLQAASAQALEQIGLYLKANPDRTFYVVGHTDGKGTLAYNQELSAARAKAVVDALVKDYGVDTGRLEAHGVGPLVPVFANSTDAGRERNRRVELVER
jgi:outer membrane protein OmpA-like peptidoglycan-associated protein